MKIKTKDKNFSGSYGMEHPLNMMSFIGANVNPAFFPTEFNGRPVGYNVGSYGAQAVSGMLPGAPGGSGTQQQATPSNSFQWSFPQYSQSWAFTPPGPQTYSGPPPFDPKSSTGTALPKPSTSAPAPTPTAPKTPMPMPTMANPSRTALTPFSLDGLMAKYMR